MVTLATKFAFFGIFAFLWGLKAAAFHPAWVVAIGAFLVWAGIASGRMHDRQVVSNPEVAA